ncbi:SDR family oxidoreductase [Bradyrhizobium sp. AUGA SZCCT0240]|uniref:SDR family oxidoreductase n=1 Tax=unclassified Bradyrhizobium TaxID=2631580 RepID=UPI001BAA47DD|nr:MULTISPECIES: SDR family oxidoreductase [unclassified Bradyrhizobium]MBR1194191.1 SDR family oxidoreductase [Bradyrhizobium sp. AUGA SZCCT0160]MBR1243489.1 SDR family oxidoreductase [Bradyrhizobium sp. AUGA SZCCT0274]MBR1258384.1 SDR family oxidoreductase [Bradyrhizobium sp. AUGA SZCCT0240]
MDTNKREFMTGVASGVFAAMAGASTMPANASAAQFADASGLNKSTNRANQDSKVRGNDKKILITGAGSGFGRNVALRLASRGHDVIASVELPSQVTSLRDAAKQQGVVLRVEKINILHERDREFASSLDVDILLNNAGTGEGGSVAEMPIDVIRSQFETNVFSSLDLTQKVVRRLIDNRRSGKIIFMSSVVGLFTPPFTGAYSASKHALEAIAESLHSELKPYGIKVATINPGPYLTGFNDRMMEAYKVWYRPQQNFIDHSKLAFPSDQFDPNTATDGIVQVVESDSGKFRTVLPANFVEITKKFQASAWDRDL